MDNSNVDWKVITNCLIRATVDRSIKLLDETLKNSSIK